MLGAIMQLTDCRPDICFSISTISQRQCTPRVKDRDALMHRIHYLWYARDKGVILSRSDSASGEMLVRLRGYADCSYACHANGKSHYSIGFDLTRTDADPFLSEHKTGLFYMK